MSSFPRCCLGSFCMLKKDLSAETVINHNNNDLGEREDSSSVFKTASSWRLLFVNLFNYIFLQNEVFLIGEKYKKIPFKYFIFSLFEYLFKKNSKWYLLGHSLNQWLST